MLQSFHVLPKSLHCSRLQTKNAVLNLVRCGSSVVLLVCAHVNQTSLLFPCRSPSPVPRSSLVWPGPAHPSAVPAVCFEALRRLICTRRFGDVFVPVESSHVQWRHGLNLDRLNRELLAEGAKQPLMTKRAQVRQFWKSHAASEALWTTGRRELVHKH